MPAAPLIAMKSTKCESLEAVGKELDRRAHTYTNDVVRSRSGLNRNYRCRDCDTQPLPLEQAIERRMGELNTKRKVRDNQVRAMGFIVSTNNQLDDATAHAFLNETLVWFCKRYGYENLLAAAEHFDEGTPHLQFWLSPVIHDELTGYDRLSAKELFAPDKRKRNAKGEWEVTAQGTMSQLQEDFYNEVSSKYGFEQPLSREKRAEGYRSLEAFKTHTGTTRELKAVIGGLEAAKQAKEAEVGQLEAQAWTASQKAAAAQRQAAQAEEQRDKTRGELGTLAQEVSKKRKLSGVLDSNISEKNAQNAALAAANGELAQQNSVLNGQLEAKTAQLDELNAEIEERLQRLEQVRCIEEACRGGELGARAERARAALAGLKPQVSAANERVSGARKALERLRGRVSEARGRVERLSAKIKNGWDKLGKIKSQVKDEPKRVPVVTRQAEKQKPTRAL